MPVSQPGVVDNEPESGSGSINGPASGSTTDNSVVRWDGTDASTLQDSTAIIDDSGSLGLNTTPSHVLDVRSTTAAANFHLGASGGTGGLFLSTNNISASGAYMSGGAQQDSDASAWRARATSATLFGAYNGDVRIYCNTGLTAGNTFTPTERFTGLSTGQFGINISNPQAMLAVANNSTAQIVCTLRGATGQSGMNLSVQDSTSTEIMGIRSNGAIKPASLADASAANDSIYYSTTAGKLVYKDSGGVVNALY